MDSQRDREIGLRSADPEHFFKFLGKPGHGGADLGGLLVHCGDHFLGHFGFVTNQFQRGDNEREIIVDVVAERGDFFIEFVHIIHGQRNWLHR